VSRKGYIVEIDPEIETSLSKVMPGVTWTNWKPVFLPETDGMVENFQASIDTFLSTFEGDKISSRKLKKTMAQENISPMTWQRAVKAFCEKDQAPKKEHMGAGLFRGG
jgi:hypothetical protein